jgi:hypothetical protein
MLVMTDEDNACNITADGERGPSYPHDSRTNLDYTYSLDKLSCVRQFYFIHITFAYLVVLSGLACFLTRLHPPLRKWHALFGRAYIVCMLWCMATSLLVHNTGLPVAVLICFVFVLAGMTAGWACIKVHQHTLQEAAMEAVQATLGTNRGIELKKELQNARHTLGNTLTWRQRMLSYKAAHGMLMFLSWINVFGRMFGSNQSGDFTCHTYPVYKQLDSPKFRGLNRPLSFVPITDPAYEKLPWSQSLVLWGFLLSIPPLIFAAAVGSACAWSNTRGHESEAQGGRGKFAMPRIGPEYKCADADK